MRRKRKHAIEARSSPTTPTRIPTTMPAMLPLDSPDDLADGDGVAVGVAEKEEVLVESVWLAALVVRTIVLGATLAILLILLI
jgi:hypothetical protein